MKKKLHLLNIVMFISILVSYGQVWQEPIKTGEYGNSTCFDNENNQFVVGEFNSISYKFQDINLLNLTNEDHAFYFAMLDSNREIKWLKIIESDWIINNPKIKLDTNKDIVMVGNYMKGITIDSVKHFDGNDYEWRNFIAKFSTNGKLKWIKYLGISLIEDFYVDKKNQIYVTGSYQGTLNFNEQSSISNQTITGYYAKFDSNGEFLYAKSIEGNWQTESYGIVTDSLENVYIGGYMAGDAYFDSKHVYSERTDQFIAKFDKNNNNIWVKHFGSTWNDRMECIYSLSFDHTGRYLYAAGVIQGTTVSYDNHALSINDKNIFLGKFTLDGDVSWVKNFGNWSGAASYTEEAKCVAVNNFGSVYLAGTFQNTASFDAHSVVSKGNTQGSSDIDLFIAKVDPTGKVSWVNRCGGDYEDRIYGLAIDYHGNPCISGQVTSISDFGDYSITGESPALGFFAIIKDTTNSTNPTTATIEIKTEDDQIKIYPTITQGQVYFANIKGDKIITVYGLTGDLISQSIVCKENNIDMTNYTDGVYLLDIEANGKHYVFRIIKDN